MNSIMTIPNLLSLVRILLTPVFIACLFYEGHAHLLAFAIFSLASFTDFYDGYLARKYNMVSKWGTFLDPFADKILVLGTFVAFYAYGVIDLWIVALIMLRDVIVTGLRIAMILHGQSMRTSWLGKWKTSLQLLSIYMLLGFLLIRSSKSLLFWPVVADIIAEFSLISIMMHVVVAVTVYSGAWYLYANRVAVRRLAAQLFGSRIRLR